MADRDDAALISRDPLVQGLGFCLDGDLVADTLAQARPDLGVRGASVTYVRYKPGTACVAAHRIDTTRGDRLACSRAVSPSGRAKLEGLQRVAERVERTADLVFLNERDTALALFPIDLRLSTRGLLNNASEVRVLDEHAPREVSAAGRTQVPLRYKPERRYVARISGATGPIGVAKWYPADGRRTYARALAASRGLRTIKGVDVPRELGHSNRHRLIFLEWEPGETLNERLERDIATESDVREAGALLRTLHDARPRGLAQLKLADPRASAECASAAIDALAPQVAERAASIAEKIVRCISTASDARPSHGDFSADQLVRGDAGWTLLDPDSAGMGDPEADVGDFLAHLCAAKLRGRVTAQKLALGRDFVEGYGGGIEPAFGGKVSAYTSLGLLRRACEPFRQRDASWPELLDRHVELAEQTLSGRDTS